MERRRNGHQVHPLVRQLWNVVYEMAAAIVTRTAAISFAPSTDQAGRTPYKRTDIVTGATAVSFAPSTSENVHLTIPTRRHPKPSMTRVSTGTAAISLAPSASHDEEVRFPLNDYDAVRFDSNCHLNLLFIASGGL